MPLATKLPSPGKLNPSLAVDAYFLVQFPGDVRRTQFRLRDHPDIASWLLSFLDYLLFKQGKIRDERRIAEPPGGESRDALIRGGVVLADQQPDGRLALRLNPNIGEMGLYVWARLRDRPAMDVAFDLGRDPELSRWLLVHCPKGGPVPEVSGLSATLEDKLRGCGVLVDELPAEEAYFPDPNPQAPVDLTAELAAMSAAFPQLAGQGIPEPVRQILGREVPNLPPDAGLIWGQDAGTGLVFPSLWPAGAPSPEAATFRGGQAARRAAQWAGQLKEARESMRMRRYAVLREIVPPAQRASLRSYVHQLVERGYFPSVGLDKQVDLRRSMYRQHTIGSLHNGLARLLSEVYGQPLMGSFNQLGLYEAGSILERHTDRPQCILNLSLVLDMQGPGGEPEPWPIYMEMAGKIEAVHLKVGDGLAYSGVEVPHWRDPLPEGQRAIVGFFFFVPPDFTGSLD